jgi:branched-chain amino acid transport system substrate-binding protein
VKAIVLDDGLNASTTVADAKQLVEQDHVVAIVGETSNLDPLWASYMQSKGVPVIGAALFNSTFETNPDYYPTGAQNPTSVYGDLAQAAALGKHKLGVLYCAESPSCTTYASLYQAIGKFVGGISVASVQKISATQPSYTADCLAARAAGADVLAILEASTVVARVADSCGQQGYTPAEVNLSYTPGVSWASDPNLQGLVTITPNQSLWTGSSSATAAYSQALRTYAPGVTSNPAYNPSNAAVWGAAEVFRLAAQRAHLTPSSTPADVVAGLDTFKNETVGGLTAPLTFTKGASKPSLVSCYFVSSVKGQKWTAPLGTKPACVPSNLVAKVSALMAK